MICYNIHRSNVAFTESIKTIIFDTALLQFDGDAKKYVEHIHNKLCLITHSATPTMSHNDLLPHILTQLCSSTVPAFQQEMQKWHINYLEGQLSTLTPTKLLTQADTKIQSLQHAGLWQEPKPTPIMTLQSQLV